MPSARPSVAVVVAALVAITGVTAVRGAPLGTARGITESGEAARIRAHLERVERELVARDVSHLTAERRAARARHIAVLRRYSDAGVFPRNHDFPGRRVPYFVDQHGTLCAMAFLIAESGRRDIVAHVAATRNNARVPDLADEPALVAWLDGAGLSLDEAARIQPSYDFEPPPDRRESVSGRYALTSGAASVMAGASIALSLRRDTSVVRREWRGAFGIASGMFTLALGLVGLDNDRSHHGIAAWNATVGMTAMALGVYALAQPAARAAPAPPVTAERGTPEVSLTVQPALRGGAPAAQVGVSARF